jgi:RHS repeat-associated protein
MSVRSLALALLVTLCAFATGVLAQQAHPRPYLVCDTCHNPPPTVTFSPSATTDANPTVSEQITVCGAGFQVNHNYATFNGTAITNFVTIAGQCLQSSGSYTYLSGGNVFLDTACSSNYNGQLGQCGQASLSVTHAPAAVARQNPIDSNLTLVPRTSDSVVFRITSQMNVSENFGLSVNCFPSPGGIASCTVASSVMIGALGSTNVTVHFAVTDSVGQTGRITLTASLGAGSASATYSYTVGHSYLVSTAYTNQEDLDLGRCAANCFGATATVSTAGYITSGAARGVRLVYNGDHVAQRPTVYADVTLMSGAPSVSKFQLQAKLLGTFATFTNGEQTLNFSASPINGSSKPFRLAGVINIDASLPSGYTTGAYQMQMIVTAFFADGHTEQTVDTTHAIAVVNSRSSPVGRGWAISGIPGLFPRFYSSLSSDDFYKVLVPTGDGSAVMYNTTNGCQPECVPTLPAGVFITLSEQFTSGGVWQGFTRIGLDSSIEFYQGTPGPGLSGHYVTLATGRTMRDTVAFTYSDSTWNPKVLTISDPLRMYNGAHTYTTLTYDANGHLASIIEPKGNTNQPNAGGRTTLVSIDASGFLRSWTDPDGGVTKFGYDSAGRLDSLTDRNGNVSTYTYEPIASKLATANTPKVPLDFNSTGTLSTIHLTTTYAPWQLVGVPTGLTSTTPWTPVEADTVEGMVTTTGGDTSRFTVNPWGQPLLQTTNALVQDTMTYDANGFLSKATRPIGAADLYTYSGPLLVTSQPAGQSATNYQYGPYAQLTQISGANQATQIFYPGTRGHIDSMSVGGATTHYYHDARLRDTLVVDALNDTTYYQYDTWTGNVARVTSLPSGRYTAKVFDTYGRDSVVTASGPDATTTVTTTMFDLLNRPDSVFDGVHPAPTVYTRDRINVIQVTDPKGQVYTTTYNALNLPVTQTDSTNRTITTTWTSHLVPATVTNRRGQMTKYLYDLQGRITHVHRPPSFTGELDTLEIVTTSRLGDTVNAWNPVTREIDYLSRATGYLDSSYTIFLLAGNRSYKRTYFHDTQGRIDSVTITVSSNVTGIDPYTRRYFYNSQTGVLDTVGVGASYIRFGRDVLFRSDTVIYPGSSSVRLDNYSSIGTLESTSWSGFNLYRGYGYDNTNRVIEIDHGIVNPDTVEQLAYDGLGELTERLIGRWNDTITTCGNQFYGNGCTATESRQILNLATDGYFFDPAGSLDSMHIGAADTIGTFNMANRLKSWGALTFAEDADGDRTGTTAGATTTNYTFSSDGRLLQIISPADTIVYNYDNYGQLASRTTHGTVDRYYLWDSNQLMAILDGSANTRIAEFAYYPGATDYPLARITGAKGSSSIHYYVLDALGNTIGQFSGSTSEQNFAYDPWGASRAQFLTSDTVQQLRWKGLFFEDGAQMYYMRARWYDPATRRFISPDPLGLTAGINQFAFGGGDPINQSDPTGTFWCGNNEFALCDGGGGYSAPGSDPGSSGGPPGNPDSAAMADCGVLPGDQCADKPNQGFCSIYAACNSGDITGTNTKFFPLAPGQSLPVGPGVGNMCGDPSYSGPCDDASISGPIDNAAFFIGVGIPGGSMQGTTFNLWGPLPNTPSQGLFGCVGLEHYQPRGGGNYGWADLWRMGYAIQVIKAYLAKCYK